MAAGTRLIAIIAAAAFLGSCGYTSDGSSADGTASTATALTGIEWQLVEIIQSGQTLRVPSNIDSVLRFDGRGGFSAEVCNHVSGEVRIFDHRLALGRRMTTEMQCHGMYAEIERAFHAITQGQLQWTVGRERLQLRRPDGDALLYVVRDSIYPHRSARDVVAGERQGFQYRLAVEGTGDDLTLYFDFRAGPGTPWGSHGLAAADPGEPAMWSIIVDDVADERFVAGFASAETVRVTRECAAGIPAVELRVYPVQGSK